MRRMICFIISMISIFTCLSAGADELRIGLFKPDGLPEGVCAYGPCTIRHSNGIYHLKSGKLLTIKCTPTGLTLDGIGRQITSSYVKLMPDGIGGNIRFYPIYTSEIRRYRGWMEVRPRNGKIMAVNHIDTEDYLRSVLPGEMPSDWPSQAFAAQAVVARSFAYASKGRHAREGFDLCSLTHCQVYRGMSYERPQTNNAVRSTAGLVIAYNGRPVAAPYHSTCGGKTTDGLYSGHRAEPFLVPVADSAKGKVFCAESPHYSWKGVTSPENIRQALQMDGIHTGKISDMKITSKDKSGRAISIKLIVGKTSSVSGYDLMMAVGRHIGYNRIRSTLFTIRKSGTKLVFTGKGLGHGMGLCQWGARGMAKQGYSPRDILKHYYPKCTLLQIEESYTVR
ncbi:MAG: SpoIID/LytB domain-containing protein [Armatimonadota bacterium]